MFRWVLFYLLVAVVCGCATPENLPNVTFDRRGVPIDWDSLPAAVRDKFRAQYPDVVPAVERCEPGPTYRLVLPSGEVLFLDSRGNISGGTI